MEASRAEFESSDAREGLTPSALFDRPLLKYVGFALLLAWHYVFWFVPNFFFHTQLLDKRVTLSWVASLLLTAVFLFILAGVLGRKRHLSDYSVVLPAAMIAASSGTVALGFFPFHLAPAGLYLVAIIILSASETTLWILWGERYACVKANFTINHIGTVFGITLFLCVFVASLLPPMITAPAAALLPLASGALLAFARKDEKRAFPVLLPRSATSSGFKNMFGVGFVTLLACAACYFLSCIIPWEVLLIMYFGILTTKGYTTPALTFAMAGGFVRLGLAAGNSLALWYESMAAPVAQALTPPTCLAFMCLLAVVLVPLVRMEFSIVALTAAPPTRNEVEEICAEAAAEFGLSAREAEILLLIARGHTTNSMAEKLVISPYTVNTHIRHIYDKMQIHKRSELLNYLNMQRSDF